MKKFEGKKLLFLVNNDWFFVSHRLLLARAAKKEGFEVVVATRVNDDADVIVREGFKLYPLKYFFGDNLNPLKEILAIFELIAIYLNERPIIVHNIGLKASLVGSVSALIYRKPGIVNYLTGLGYIFTHQKFKTRLLRKIIFFVFSILQKRKKTRFVFQNAFDRSEFINNDAVSENNSLLIRGSGVDTEAYRYEPEPPGEPVVLFAGRILWDKGVGDLVEAVKILRQRKLNFTTIIAGTPDKGNPNAVPEKVLEQWNNDGTVEWIGYQSDMPSVIANSHIVCLPTFYREGLPKILIESASCGRPIVTTDIPGCNDLVRHQVNGLLCPTKSPESLADAMQILIESKKLRSSYGLKSRKLVQEHFSIENIIEQTFSVYNELLSQ